MAYLRLNDVSVEFPIYNSMGRSLRHTLFRSVGGQVAAHNEVVTVKALSGITLDLKPGDRLGIIGHNGAGKTTLLRVFAGAYWPTTGTIESGGTRTALTDIGMGLDGELTGYENIVNKLVLMGLNFAEAKSRIPEIEEFSELGEYLGLPMRTYSTGMYLRLAFAVSTTLVPDILILDEMIGAGDARFIEKAKQRTDEFLNKTKIMLISSHDLALLKRYCNKVLWLDGGKVRRYGDVDDIIAEYVGAPTA
jgi:ABC-type polysaccharide/polyol phosphate transport system ATPase subunit